MIIHTEGMREIEKNSGYSNEELMEKAGHALAEAIGTSSVGKRKNMRFRLNKAFFYVK